MTESVHNGRYTGSLQATQHEPFENVGHHGPGSIHDNVRRLALFVGFHFVNSRG